MGLIICDFNSTLVRLKVTVWEAVKTVPASFQFHIGTIKSVTERSYTYPPILFQFHIGTIKSKYERDVYKTSPKFQFHIGTIKRERIQKLVELKLISIPHWYD